ncbi:MAG: hypothetical protein ACI9W4_001084 [Rhodothermales bacterium]|jgi:hypothetical protein
MVTEQATRLRRFVSRLDDRIRTLEAVSLRFSRARLFVFLAAVVSSILAFRALDSGAEWAVLLGFVLVFVGLTRRHETLHRAIRRHRVYRTIKLQHLARMGREWKGLGRASSVPGPEEHPFAHDLDILGQRSLHHLLDTSFSSGGSNRLALWLTQEEPDRQAALDRQQLVRELVPLGALRDRISLLSQVTGGKEASERFDGDVLVRWLARHRDDKRMRPFLGLLSGLALLNWALVATHVAGLTGPWWAFSLTAYLTIYILNGRLYSHLFDEAEHLHDQLERFRPVVQRLESYCFQPGSALLRHLEPFQDPRKRPSVYLRRVMMLSMAASARKSEILRILFNVVLPWDLLFAYRLAIYKEQLRELLPVWLDTVYRLEAAGSLATYAALNPEAVFPAIGAPDTRPVFEARGLAHPMIGMDESVRNDFAVQAPPHITLVTGSNMSGKSTFLRAIGVGQVMAMAGGPVEALSFATVPFRVFSSMGIHDSLTDGISFFYAEVRRLGRMQRAVAGSGAPSMVLIDEIFRGTNNRERLIGSRALLESLAGQRCLGLVATHDLELVSLGDDLPAFDNCHFREEVEEGRMLFDYLLRPGPCPTTNALKIMAAEGLPVPRDPDAGNV